MKQKDLAEEYLTKAKESDIKAAFNAGRENVVENMPKIEWENVSEDLSTKTNSDVGT